MGKIQGQPFGLVVSKTPQEALTESVKAGNEAKFYVHSTDSVLDGAVSDGAGNGSKACEITINGNVLRGMSAKEQAKLKQFLDVDPATVYKFKGTVKSYDDLLKVPSAKAGDVYNVTYPGSSSYPANTNFAATKDGPGSLAEWDSLGGIQFDINTAIGIPSNVVNSDNDTLMVQTNSDTQPLFKQLTLKCGKGLQFVPASTELTDPATLNLNIGSNLTLESNRLDCTIEPIDPLDLQPNGTVSLKINNNHLQVRDGKLDLSTNQIFISTNTPNVNFVNDNLKFSTPIAQTGVHNLLSGFNIKLASYFDYNSNIGLQIKTNGQKGIAVNGDGLYIKTGTGLSFDGQGCLECPITVDGGLYIYDNVINIKNPAESENLSLYSLSTKSIVVHQDNNYLALKIASKYVDTALNNNDVAKDPIREGVNILRTCNNGIYISSNSLANFVQAMIDRALAAK